MAKRNQQFYNELAQLNKDMVKFINDCHQQSVFNDYTPSFEDYITQIKAIDKKYPEENNTKPSLQLNNQAPPIFTAPASTAFSGLAFTSTSLTSPSNNTLSFSSTTPATSTTTTTTTIATPTSTFLSSIQTSSAAPPILSFGSSTLASTTNSNHSNTSLASKIPSLSTSTNTTGSLFSSTFASTASTNLFDNKTTPLFSFGSSNNASNPAPFSFKLPDPNTTNTTIINNTTNTTIVKDGEEGGDDNEEDQPPPEPKIDKYEETGYKHSARCKLYTKNSKTNDPCLLGIGNVYVKEMDSPNKLHIVFRVEPDYRRVLMNEIITQGIPMKPFPKALQIVLPGTDGSRIFIFKLKDDKEAQSLQEVLNSVNKS